MPATLATPAVSGFGAGRVRGSSRPAPEDIAVLTRRRHSDETTARLVAVFVSRRHGMHPVLAIANTWGVSCSTVHRDYRTADRLVRSDPDFYLSVLAVLNHP